MTTFPRPDTVSIVACGPSAVARGAASAPGLVVAVNGAWRHVPFAVSLSMDGRFARNEWDDLYGRVCMWRDSAVQHAYDAGATSWKDLNAFTCDRHTTKFAENGDAVHWQLNGDHSGYCALNFAYSLRPRRVYLYGFDMDEPTHFFGEYPWADEAARNTRNKFAKWVADMDHAARQFRKAGIDVANTNPRSAIRAFRTARP